MTSEKRIKLGFFFDPSLENVAILVLLHITNYGSPYISCRLTGVCDEFTLTPSVFHYIIDVGLHEVYESLLVACQFLAYKTFKLHEPTYSELGVLKVAITFLDYLVRKRVEEEDRVDAIAILKDCYGRMKYFCGKKADTWMTRSICRLDELIGEEAVLRLEWYSVRKIQRVWRKNIVNPMYEVCRRRLLKEFNDLL
jgi:hypothetical protein